MIGVDANVLVRFFVADDARQAAIATRFLGERTTDDPAFVSIVVVVEFCWVLKRFYGVPLQNICDSLQVLAGSPSMRIERHDHVVAAIELARSKRADIADALIAAVALEAGAGQIMTFDQTAAKRVPAMEMLR